MTNFSLSSEQNQNTAAKLARVLADTYALYFKTHAYHWNVTGPRFHDLHALFELQYNELWTATDEIAERVRALGFPAPNSYTAMSDAASLPASAEADNADAMVADLLKSHEAVVATIRNALDLAGEHGDEATADILTPRLTVHEKTAWMLRATFG